MKTRPAGVPDRAWQSSKLPDEVRFLGGALEEMSSECEGFARDPAKVEDQARLLARTLDDLALEPDGTAAACKAVFKWVRLPPALLGSMIRPGQRRPSPRLDGGWQRVFRTWVVTKVVLTG